MSGPASAPELAPCKHCGKYHAPHLLKCPTTDMMLDLRGRILDNKFRLIRQLGTGGMAEVWLARNEAVDRRVAIKLLRPEVTRNDDAVARFRAEARAAGRINSPHICEILDLGMSPIGPYIVMEWLRGRDLAEWVEDEGCLNLSDAVWITRQALLGLTDAHAAGILHRDLKPGNLFLHRLESGETVIKIMDFGVSKFLDGTAESLTLAGMMLGTPEYMAPEQLMAAGEVDERADVYSMGAILYRILSGQRVYSGPNLASVCHAVATEDPKPLDELVEGLPSSIVEIVHQCLSRDPQERPTSAVELREMLSEYEIAPPAWAGVGETGASTPRNDTPLPRAVAPAPRRRRRRWRRSLLESVVSLGGLSLIGYGIWCAFQPIHPEASGAPAIENTSRDATVLASSVVSDARRASPRSDKNSLNEEGRRNDDASKIARKDASDDHAESPRDDVLEVRNTGATRGRTDHPPRSRTRRDGLDNLPEPGTALPDLNVSSNESRAKDEDLEKAKIEDAGLSKDKQSEDSSKEQATNASADTKAVPSTTPDPNALPHPPGTVRAGVLVGLVDRAPAMSHYDAKRYCAELGQAGHLGFHGWRLANPTEIRQFLSVRGVPRGKFWTSAMWKGKARVQSLPSGRDFSAKVSRRFIRPFCIVISK